MDAGKLCVFTTLDGVKSENIRVAAGILTMPVMMDPDIAIE